jgi:2-amino-4-hydroxy-6-hydroxymethyldihydropteridine diphosphokinase
MEPLPVAVWRPAYVAIGSNLNEPRLRVDDAFERLAVVRATRLLLRSRIYRSQPMGPQDQPDYVNAVAGLLTRLTAREMLAELLELERAAGRERRQRWGPRVLDLDLVWMGGSAIDEPALTLPHPGVSERNFVLYPLFDIAPELVIPGHGRVADLKARVGGDGLVIVE